MMKKDHFDSEKMRKIIQSPLQVGNVIVKNRLALAPLAGTTEVVFRSICNQFDVGLTTTELVSARGICYDPKLTRNYQYLEIDPAKEDQVSIQFFGHDPADFTKAAQTILQHPVLNKCSILDINMGCPMKKIVKQGAGSALMKNPILAQRIVNSTAEVAARYNKPVSVKIRSGWDRGSINAPEFAKLMQEAGSAMITLHARTREQIYSGSADWNVIKQTVEQVSVPVYGNGDLTDLNTISKMYDQTGCAGFAIGRAALGNPWIFGEILNNSSRPDRVELVEVIVKHLDGMIVKIGDESVALKKMRPQLASYLKGKRNAAKTRNLIMKANSKQEILEILNLVQ
jgi:tRNA-dihydrouridine synthase B